MLILALRHMVVHVPDDGTDPEPAHAPYPVNVQLAQPYAHSINEGSAYVAQPDDAGIVKELLSIQLQ